MENYIRLINFSRPYWGRLFIGMLCLYAGSAAQLSMPILIKILTDRVLIPKDVALLNLLSLGVIVLFAFRGVLGYASSYLLDYVGQKMVFDLRNSLFNSMFNNRGLAYFESSRTGALMSYYNNDINVLRSSVTGAGMDILRESVVIIFSVAYMLYLDWRLSLLTFISTPLIAIAVRKIGRKIKKASVEVLVQFQEFSAMLQEVLSGVRQVKSFAREEFEMNRFAKQTNRNFRAAMKATKANALLTPVVELLATAGGVFLIWVGCRQVINGYLSQGEFIAFMIFAINLNNPIKRISRAFGRIQEFQAACERIFGTMDAEPEVKDAPDASIMPRIEGQVSFEQVSFAYNTTCPPAIDNFSFMSKPGQTIALVGPSGAGKTTLGNLVMRFYDVTAGSVKIDGIDVRSVTQKSLREQIGIVPQDIFLFTGTIYDNIRYGCMEATEEEVVAAAEAAYVTSFTDLQPEGLKTLVGERGMTLSGGQRQRVAIARAILKDPRILVLDEATSALDTESERLVQQALDKLLKGRTSFIIAHRLSTIFRADIILVMNHGQLVEQGTHQELLAQSGLYANLYHTQFSNDEGIREESDLVLRKSETI